MVLTHLFVDYQALRKERPVNNKNLCQFLFLLVSEISTKSSPRCCGVVHKIGAIAQRSDIGSEDELVRGSSLLLVIELCGHERRNNLKT